MKFLMFSDFHCYPGVFLAGTPEDMRFLQRRAAEEGCEFLLHAGDLCHGPELVPELMAVCDSSPLPIYHCLGNHDTDSTPLARTLDAYHMPDGHYFFDHGGYRFIVCDPNYYRDGDAYIHYDTGNYFSHGPQRDWLPPDQLRWLEETVGASPFPCILISHESFERETDGVKNGAAVREIVRNANRKKPHSVLLCINGHYHRDNLRILDGVLWWDLNSTSYDWIDIPHRLYPEELYEQHRLVGNTVVYNDLLYAVVELEGTTVRIRGRESSMLYGINRQHTENPVYDAMGRPVSPTIQSVCVTL